MIVIRQFPNCGFGNKMLYYNNMRQIAARKKQGYLCPRWDGDTVFNLKKGQSTNEQNEFLDFCLGEKFFDGDVRTRDIFELRNVKDTPENSVAIHFRGTDFYSWNPDAVLDSSYYINSIDCIDDASVYYIFTDDTNLESYKEVLLYLKDKEVVLGQRNLFVDDFNTMAQCDYIISSPSTFCVCAGFVGKNKKIIHSEKWINNRVAVDDKFWVDLNNGGNEDYSIWRLV